MSGDKTILNELRAISPVVAGIEPGTGTYRVADGYFDAFAMTALARIKGGETTSVAADPAILADLRDQAAYKVPAGFFDGFAETLIKRIKADAAVSASEELEILSPLLSGLAKKEPFSAPTGYFSELPGNLVAELQALSFVNGELEKSDEWDKNDESIDLSPLMKELKNKQTYIGPEGYFDSLASTLLSKVSGTRLIKVHREDTNVISMDRGRVKSWMKYAVAAALTGLLVTTGIRVYHRSDKPVITTPSSGGDATGSLARISDQEILNYLHDQNEQDEPLAETVTNSTATLDINDSDVKDFLGDVPDAELKQYADEHSGSKNPLTN